MAIPFIALAGFALAGAAAFVAARRLKPFRRIYDGEHLADFAVCALDAQDSAHDLLEWSAPGPSPGGIDDPRSAVSGAGFLIHYRIGRGHGNFVHHVSLSYPSEHPAWAIGEMFTAFLVHLYQVPPEATRVTVSEQRVFHLTFELSPEGQMDYPRDDEGDEISAYRASELWTAALALRRRLKFERESPNTWRT